MEVREGFCVGCCSWDIFDGFSYFAGKTLSVLFPIFHSNGEYERLADLKLNKRVFVPSIWSYEGGGWR